MSEIKEFAYATKSGKYSFTICNAAAAITKLCVPDRSGNLLNVVLPVKDISNIFSSDGCLGFIVGRFANRIKDATFDLNGKTYSFEPNDGKNLLHSGKGSCSNKIWDVRKESDGFTCYCKILSSEDCFPGDLDVWVRYSLNESGLFSIRYKILCSEDTPINFTNHAYFNLSGNCGNTILNHKAKFSSSKYLECNDELLPTGKILPVENTCFDFREEKQIGLNIPEMGYDHCFVIDRPFNQDRGYIQFCRIECEQTGIILKGYTDLPGFHFYTGNSLSPSKNYERQTGFCLETEFYPDSVHFDDFPSCILKAGSLFESTTSFAFSVK